MKGTSEEACEHSKREAKSANAIRAFAIGSAIGTVKRERERERETEREEYVVVFF